MSLRGVLFVVALILGLLFYTGKAQEWWGYMKRAATQVYTVPPDSLP